MLTQLLGCSYAEAAAICGCPVGTIRSRVARAREDLDAMTADPDAASAAGIATARARHRQLPAAAGWLPQPGPRVVARYSPATRPAILREYPWRVYTNTREGFIWEAGI